MSTVKQSVKLGDKVAGFFSRNPFISVALLPLDHSSAVGPETLLLDARTVEAISDRVATEGSFTIHTSGGHNYKCGAGDLNLVKNTWAALRG